MSAARSIVVILGCGPGLGYSCARTFAKAGHPVALLARSLPKLQGLADQINKEVKDSGRARAYEVDATKGAQIERAFQQIQQDWKGQAFVKTAIHNPGGGFVIKPFMEATEDDLKMALETQAVGGFNFFQSFLRALQSDPDWEKPGEPDAALGNIMVTGATASLRGGAKFGTFAASKFALKALAESLAREYGSQGVHVSHFIIDGLIITERTTAMLGDKWDPHSRMEPDAIAQVYLDVSRQKRSAWTFNLDLRPGPEKFS
ncbi:hypothetical protein CBS101457_004754 [Exobasidium rhododendri]|nr:hypothetical protein CBS101457_004754 [Exobasidium rhododendri]